MDESRPATRIDLLTVAAIGVVAYVVSNVFHEGIGHGGACFAVGDRPIAVSSAWLDCPREAGDWASRAVSAGGTLANLVVGTACALWLRARAPQSAHARYFLWLTMMVNLLQGGGYLMVSPFLGFGDWTAFLEGFAGTRLLVWKVALTAAGAGISVGAVAIGLRTLEPLVGTLPGRARRARLLTWIPYFASAAIFLAAALRDPLRGVALTGLLAAHFGGTAWLAWLLPFKVKDVTVAEPQAPLELSRRWGWLACGAVAAFVCVLVLGPSLKLG